MSGDEPSAAMARWRENLIAASGKAIRRPLTPEHRAAISAGQKRFWRKRLPRASTAIHWTPAMIATANVYQRRGFTLAETAAKIGVGVCTLIRWRARTKTTTGETA